MTVTVIDYQIGNVQSVVNMLIRIGCNVKVANHWKEIKSGDKFVLPGVGSFDRGMSNLRNLNLVEALQEEILQKGKPILGICLGMQLFSVSSEEGIQRGLGWIDGEVIKFKIGEKDRETKIPHMGWNEVKIVREHLVFKEVKQPMRFYFVHSYHYIMNPYYTVAVTDYCESFPAVIVKDNIFGVQFHPEKSHIYGMQILRNFVYLI